MSTPRSVRSSGEGGGVGPSTPSVEAPPSYTQPTYASFSPATLSATTSSAAKRRSTILVHQKSPLLLATPPQVTRALAYSHPFLLPLNKLAGLLTWTTGDPWESFLLLVVFWAVVHYGDVMIRYAGPIVVVLALIAGMYGRRYSPLSSSGWGEHPSLAASNKDGKKKGSGGGAGANGHERHASETSTRHQKTLDEIVETLKVFTSRCNILMEPLLEMTDFLSTQRTATSATTRPALTALFVRILAVTPVWIILMLPPLRIITTKRVIMLAGTLFLTWHSRICRVARTILWRSASIRKIARWVTGLEFEGPTKPTNTLGIGDSKPLDGKKTPMTASKATSALTAALKRSSRAGNMQTGVRFTFILYENQRRWVGLGWTNNMFAYERAAWTDEHNNSVPPKDQFELPEVEDGYAKWRWVAGSKWKVDGVSGDVENESEYDGEKGKNGWVYYDNKWNYPRRGADGWGKWTRRRKWYRDAELVEADAPDHEPTEDIPSPPPPELPARPGTEASAINIDRTANGEASTANDDSASIASTSNKSRFRFPGRPGSMRRRGTGGTVASSTGRSRASTSESGLKVGSYDDDDAEVGSLGPALDLEIHGSANERGSWGIGDDARMGLE